MKGMVFYKMTGSGNDFVMLDGRHTRDAEWPAAEIARLCDRRMGVGADGLVIVTPRGEGQIRMQYWNSDGSSAAMCGNAALCSTRLAAYLEMAPATGMTLQTDAGLVQTRCTGADHLAEISLPGFALPEPVRLEMRAGESAFYFATVGVPHLVVITSDVAAVDLVGRGRELRFHPSLGPGGANVNFVSPPESGNGGPWTIRTYERGVEAETLACGTGTVAAAFALEVARIQPLPSEWRTFQGARLGVSGTAEGARSGQAWLLGEGRLVFTGVLHE
jgi:diaminopimelate epimerase